jgi:uncharacterized protein YceK
VASRRAAGVPQSKLAKLSVCGRVHAEHLHVQMIFDQCTHRSTKRAYAIGMTGRSASHISLALILLGASSCGTICTVVAKDCGPFGPYSGTRASAQGHATQLDVPLSFIADTALLPVSVPVAVMRAIHRRKAHAPATSGESKTTNGEGNKATAP